jgi:hypothetical protein
VAFPYTRAPPAFTSWSAGLLSRCRKSIRLRDEVKLGRGDAQRMGPLSLNR